MEAIEARPTPLELRRVAVLLEVTPYRAVSELPVPIGIPLAVETPIFDHLQRLANLNLTDMPSLAVVRREISAALAAKAS